MRHASTPVLLHDVLADAREVEHLLRAIAPIRPLGGWFRSGATAEVPSLPMWFQADFVHADLRVPGAELFLDHPGFAEAARAAYGAAIVEPHTVYANVMGPIAAHGPAHTDNPTFRGLDRTNTPMHVLRLMYWSGLFDEWGITQATAIWWMNDVDGGALLYWPDGPTVAPTRHEGAMANTALVGDNHGMFHQVGPIAATSAPPLVTSHAELAPALDGQWEVVDQGRVVHRAPFEQYRVSVLWKANVYTDAAERDRAAVDRLAIDDVVATFNDDLARRGESLRLTVDSLRDPATKPLLTAMYPDPVPVGAGATT